MNCFFFHDHPDHIGGVLRVLDTRPDITVSLVESFPWGFKNAVAQRGCTVRETDQPCAISANYLSTGEMASAGKNFYRLHINRWCGR